MSDEHKDWVDEAFEPFNVPDHFVSEGAKAQVRMYVRSHAPTPPPVPESVKALGLKCVQLWSRREIETGQLANEATRLIQSFLTTRDQKRDAVQRKVVELYQGDIDKLTAERQETVRVLEQAKTGLGELLQHGSPVPYGDEGQPVPYESNPEVATSAIKALTTHLQKLKGRP